MAAADKARYKEKAIDYTKAALSKYALRVFNAFAKEKVSALVEKTVNRAKKYFIKVIESHPGTELASHAAEWLEKIRKKTYKGIL